MKKNILYLIAILAMCQGIFAMEMTQEALDFQEQVNEARWLVSQGKFDEAYNIFRKLERNPLAQSESDTPIYLRMVQDLGKYIPQAKNRASEKKLMNEFWALHHEAQQLVNQGKLEDAQGKYNKLKTTYDNIKALTPFGSRNELYESAIADLENAISQLQTK